MLWKGDNERCIFRVSSHRKQKRFIRKCFSFLLNTLKKIKKPRMAQQIPCFGIKPGIYKCDRNKGSHTMTHGATNLTSSLAGSHWARSSSLVRMSFPSRRRRWRSESMRARVSVRCWWWSWRRVTLFCPSVALSSDMMVTKRRPHTWQCPRNGSTSWWKQHIAGTS